MAHFHRDVIEQDFPVVAEHSAIDEKPVSHFTRELIEIDRALQASFAQR